jgi:hypothetical protein
MGTHDEKCNLSRRWRRLAQVVSTMAEETGGVESGDEETSGYLEFCDESETTRGRLLFIGSKISISVLN